MMRRFSTKKTLSILLCATASATLFYFILRKLDLPLVLTQSRILPVSVLLAAAAVAIFFNFFQSAFVLQSSLSLFGFSMSYRESLFVTAAGAAFKFIPPANIGDLLKSVYLKKNRNIPAGVSVCAILLVLALKLMILLLASLAAALFKAPGQTVPSAAFGLVPLLSLVAFLPFRGSFLPSRIPSRPPGAKWKNPGAIVLLLLHVTANLAGEIAVFIIIVHGLGLSIPIDKIFQALPLCIVIAKVPVTLLGLGSREAAILYFFARSASAEALFSASFLFSLVEYILPVLLGALFAFPYLRAITGGKSDVP